MAVTLVTPEAISRLKNQLLISNLQQKDPPLFQVINQLIGIVQGNSNSINSDGSVGPAGINGKDGVPGFLFNDSFDGNDGLIIPGVNGKDGINGTNGTNGINGTIGSPGENGLDADIFLIPGPQGIQGIQGNTGPSGTGAIQSVTINLTDAQVKSLNTVPVVVLAAQGAGITIVPLFWTVGANITTGFNQNSSWNIQYTGGSASGLVAQTVTLTAIIRRMANSQTFTAANNVGVTGKENTSVEVFSNAAVTTGVTSGGFNFTMYFVTITIP
jgi:hypothetical protein